MVSVSALGRWFKSKQRINCHGLSGGHLVDYKDRCNFDILATSVVLIVSSEPLPGWAPGEGVSAGVSEKAWSSLSWLLELKHGQKQGRSGRCHLYPNC